MTAQASDTKQRDPQHVVGRLKLHKAVQDDDGAAPVRVLKDAEAVVILIALIVARAEDVVQALHHRLAVQGGDVVGVHLPHLLAAGEPDR